MMSRSVWLIASVGFALLPWLRIAQQEPRPIYRAGVALVFVNVSVKQGNVPVTGLGAEDFVVFDKGVRQKIDRVGFEPVPIDLTLFHDTSNSQAGRIESLKEDVRNIAAFLRPGDRIRLLTLDFQVKDVFGWQPAGTQPDLSAVRLGRNSAVYDPIFAAMLHQPDPDRRHLIVALTDGVDAGSVVGSQAVLDAARHAEGVLHLVLLQRRSGSGRVAGYWAPTRADRDGLRRLEQAAELTGGRVYTQIFRANVISNFRQAFEEFRQSYVLRYTPSGVPANGWHDIKVELPAYPRATIRARKGYFGAASGF